MKLARLRAALLGLGAASAVLMHFLPVGRTPTLTFSLWRYDALMPSASGHWPFIPGARSGLPPGVMSIHWPLLAVAGSLAVTWCCWRLVAGRRVAGYAWLAAVPLAWLLVAQWLAIRDSYWGGRPAFQVAYVTAVVVAATAPLLVMRLEAKDDSQGHAMERAANGTVMPMLLAASILTVCLLAAAAAQLSEPDPFRVAPDDGDLAVEYFGQGVTSSGDTLLVSAVRWPDEHSKTGESYRRAYTYQWTPAGLQPTGVIAAPPGSLSFDLDGLSMVSHGDVVLLATVAQEAGREGHLAWWSRAGGQWQQEGAHSLALPYARAPEVVLDGDVAFAGIPASVNPDFAGAIEVFRLTDGGWQHDTTIHPDDGARFGRPLAGNATRLAVAATGGVAILVPHNGTWITEALVSLDTAGSDGGYTKTVDLEGHWLAIGYSRPDGADVLIYRLDGSQWQHVQTLPPPPGEYSVALDLHGDRLLVGHPVMRHSFKAPGQAFLYERNGNHWEQIQHYQSSAKHYGAAVTLNDHAAVVGSGGDPKTGSIRVYPLEG